MGMAARWTCLTIVLLCTPSAAAQPGPPPLALVTTYADRRVTESVVGPNGFRAWTPFYPRVADWHDRRGTLPVTALNIVASVAAAITKIARVHYPLDHYLQARAMWIEYRGIRIVNHHRPLSTCMRLLLDAGLALSHFDELRPSPETPASRAAAHARVPWFHVMEWRKPAMWRRRDCPDAVARVPLPDPVGLPVTRHGHLVTMPIRRVYGVVPPPSRHRPV